MGVPPLLICGLLCGAVKQKQTPAILLRSVVDQRIHDFIVGEFVRLFILVKNIILALLDLVQMLGKGPEYYQL